MIQQSYAVPHLYILSVEGVEAQHLADKIADKMENVILGSCIFSIRATNVYSMSIASKPTPHSRDNYNFLGMAGHYVLVSRAMT